MARALQVFALLSALFVIAVRCMSAFPSVSPAAHGSSSASIVAARPSGGAQGQESLLVADLDDDSDDAPDALITPAPFRLLASPDGESAGAECGAWVEQRALQSHTQSVDRPPRA